MVFREGAENRTRGRMRSPGFRCACPDGVGSLAEGSGYVTAETVRRSGDSAPAGRGASVTTQNSAGAPTVSPEGRPISCAGTSENRRHADYCCSTAERFIAATGYHRRDGELAALRAAIDQAGAA